MARLLLLRDRGHRDLQVTGSHGSTYGRDPLGNREAGGARRFTEVLRGDGLLLKETHEHTLRLAPPLVITKEELELACEKLDRVLTRHQQP